MREVAVEVAYLASEISAIMAICRTCLGLCDSEDDGSILGMWENSKGDMIRAREVADFHQGKRPGHNVVINVYSTDN